jgi:hypothetical protein
LCNCLFWIINCSVTTGFSIVQSLNHLRQCQHHRLLPTSSSQLSCYRSLRVRSCGVGVGT